MKKQMLAAVSLVLCTAAYSQTFLGGAFAEVRLSISDKFAAKAEPVEFTVTQPNGTITKATAEPINNGDRAGDVFYPSSFGNAGKHYGVYKWAASMNGKQVASGSFAYQPTKGGEKVFVPTK
jgi:hypothetical protein